MDWTWITGLNWNLIRDVTVPIASILIPSVIAIWLARSERKAARADRQAETLSKGIEEAFAAMADLTEAAYTDDIRENAKIRLRAASRIERIEHGLGRDNEVVWDWMSEELGIVAQGLEERNDVGLPLLMQEVVWRAANFSTIVSNWRSGKVHRDWFTSADHPALVDTMPPEAADEADRRALQEADQA
jgi:hypothetical protein